jgi:hypothetical protein
MSVAENLPESPAQTHNESPSTIFTYSYEIINTLLTTALNAKSYDSALARTILNGGEPYATLVRQLDAQVTHSVESLSATVTLVSQPQRKPGRPPGSGTYPTADAFLQAVRPIIQGLCREGRHPSQARVAELLPLRMSVRQLQRWGERHHLSWTEVLKTCDLLSF